MADVSVDVNAAVSVGVSGIGGGGARAWTWASSLAGQFRQHGNDTMKQLLGLVCLVHPNKLQRAAHVHSRSAFHGASPSDVEVLPTIGLGPFSGTFANVQWDAHGRTTDLVNEIGVSSWQAGTDLMGQREKFDRALIDIEPLVAKH